MTTFFEQYNKEKTLFENAQAVTKCQSALFSAPQNVSDRVMAIVVAINNGHYKNAIRLLKNDGHFNICESYPKLKEQFLLIIDAQNNKSVKDNPTLNIMKYLLDKINEPFNIDNNISPSRVKILTYFQKHLDAAFALQKSSVSFDDYVKTTENYAEEIGGAAWLLYRANQETQPENHFTPKV